MATRRRGVRDFVAPPFTRADVEAVSARFNEPEWLREMRLNAWDLYESLPMPTTQDEAWRRTDYRHINWETAGTLVPATGSGFEAIPEANRRPLLGDDQGAMIAFVDGECVHHEVNEALASQGVIFMDLHQAAAEHADLVKEHLFTHAVLPSADKFAALNAALWTHGVFLYVPRGKAVSLPAHSIFYNTQTGATLGHILVVLDEGAQIDYLHESLSTDMAQDASYVGATELILKDGANLRFVNLQDWGDGMFEFSHQRARVSNDGQLDWVTGQMGGKLVKAFMEIDLDGKGSWGRMSGVYFPAGQQFFDLDTQQNHNAPNTTSDLLYKGVLKDKAHTVWQGMIKALPGAQKTDGFQANRNMLMSDDARADSIPGLEIQADDVRCTHASATGQIEEELLFYLMARGIPRKDAEKLVVDGFFVPVLDRIPFENVRERMMAYIERKLLA
ncbi:MAG TPA: Fe-S cluster assembly protein SufD [Aggregatilinea sp.]|uniref:Fe-S cluster assembly protein SufD n=1 Tax=Aggregatilinea sp. TaxID=2806333 RepID=UPI002C275B06|nr:Fe-S cluster assembly protein SufD [Aggregatilinea sp.]HML23037.1 Fe-S cluster assembly protein SufD [Aggregatilinea sp.]